MAGIKDEIKNAFRYNNAVVQLIIINVIIWLGMMTLMIFSNIFGAESLFPEFYNLFAIPADAQEFIFKPWTIISYAFMHSHTSLMHILFNMLYLYWFGRLIQEYLGYKRVVSLYVLGAIAGGAIYLLVYNVVPFYAQDKAYATMVGASAAGLAIVVGAATLLPDYRFHLIFFGPVKIVYIAGFLVIMSYVSVTGSNAGGNIAHLGGALMGFIFIKQLQKGNDWGTWVIKTIDIVKGIFKPKPKVKVSYRKTEKAHSSKSKNYSGSGSSKSSANTPSQEEIDAILDKIAQSGYESLSKAEKEKLFNASK